MKYKVVVTRKIPDVGISLLKKAGFEVVVNPYDRVLKREELKRMLKGAHGILSLLTDKIDGEILDAAGPQLKIVANYAVGYDNFNLDDFKARKIYATNTPGVLTETVAEHAIGLLFAIAQRIVEADEFVRQGKFKGWGPMLFLGTDIRNKTLGIVGLGRIGAEVAKRMRDGFGLTIIYYDAKRNLDLEKELKIKYVPFKQLLKKSDFISIHVPLLPTTRHMFTLKEFKLMKPTAYIINTARGAVINEKDLVIALKKKMIAGAALDVYEFEPKVTPELIKLPNTVLLPHIASASIETRSKMAEMAAKNIIAVLKGKKPLNPILK
ncbi:MAG: D-glycerate dehydrogenase [Patescibacteria group bacterium]|jgi:glyoxylate reductase|nr:D-glycerate dehydrogenase [Patescibacteria group bacterium]